MKLARIAIVTCCGAAVICAALSYGSALSTAKYERSNMTPLSPRLQLMFAKSKTVCFGRFALEVPASAKIVFGRMTVENEIFYAPGEAGMVDKQVSERLAQIDKYAFANRKMATPNSLYRHVIDGGVPGQKSVVGADDGQYNLRSYAPVGSGLFIFEHNRLFSTEDVRAEIASIESIARRMRARAEDDIPAEPGICLEGGFINMNPEYETISMGVRLAEFPDVHLSIELLKNRGHVYMELDLDTQLKEAADSARSEGYAGWYARIKVLRRGKRMIGDWDGKEALAHKPPQDNNGDNHQFVFQAVGHETDPMLPQAKVEMFTGLDKDKIGGKRPSLSDEEAVALWDKLTGSIRARPTTPPRAADTGLVALGTTLLAGQSCPQDGWWDCGDEGDGIETVNGRRQFFRLRDVMPQAVLSRRKTLLQRIGREQPTFQLGTPTIWTLTAYDQATVDRLAASNASSAPEAMLNLPKRSD
jgi:hypothetical protein